MIYIDKDYKCHVENDGTMTAIETDAFDGKCKEYIEGFRFVPAGESWTREDGVVFQGEMLTPSYPYEELEAIQKTHDAQRAAENEEALRIMGVIM